MEALDYRLNPLAQSLRGAESHTIGLILADNANPFFAEVSRVLEDVSLAPEYSAILFHTGDDLERERAYVDTPIAKQVDGIIFKAAGDNREHLDALICQSIPLVLADRDVREAEVDVVLVNNEQGGRRAAAYWLGLGHRRIGCIAGPVEGHAER